MALPLILVALAVVSLGFVPGFRESAAVFWIGGFVLMALALFVALRAENGAQHGANKSTRAVSIVAVAVVAAVVAVGTVRVANSAPEPSAETFSVQGGTTQVSTVSRETITPDLSNDKVEALAQDAKDMDAEATEITGQRAEQWIDAARSAGYQAKSGLEMDYANAFVADYGVTTAVIVPLLGTDLPEVTRVAFLETGGTSTISEIAASMIDANHVDLKIWQDGSQIKNAVLENPDAKGSEGGIVQTGVDWTKLNNCLNSIGISWAILAVISVACAAACAAVVACGACIAGMAGWTGGSIAGCVKTAWV